MNILAFDPGKHNFAYCLLKDGTVRDYGFMETMHELTNSSLPEGSKAFIKNVKQLLKDTQLRKGDCVVIERFQYRPGKGRGSVCELTNLMIGMLISQLKTPAYLVTPASWKNYMTRHYGMDKRGMRELLGSEHLTTHEADAIGIACYYYEHETDISCVNTCFH